MFNDSCPFIPSIRFENSTIKKYEDIRLISFPWNHQRLKNSLAQTMIQDSKQLNDHHVDFFHPIRIGFIDLGFDRSPVNTLMHKGDFDMNDQNVIHFDLSPLYNLIRVNQSMEWEPLNELVRIPEFFNINKAIEHNEYVQNAYIKYWQIAAIYEISRLMSINKLIK